MRSLMAFTVAAICSFVIFAGPGRVLPVAARRRASAASLRAWVSVIHWPTTAGSAPELSGVGAPVVGLVVVPAALHAAVADAAEQQAAQHVGAGLVRGRRVT